MRRPILHLLLALVAGAVLAAGCGSDDDGDGDDASDTPETTAATSPTDDDTGDEADEADEGAGDEAGSSEPGSDLAGTATVSGTTYDLDQVISCDPDDPNQVDGLLLDLTGVGSADGAQINVFITEFSGAETHLVDWSGPEGILSGAGQLQADGWVTDDGSALPGAPFELGASSVSGALVVTSEEGESLDLEFELPLPLEFSPCF